EEGRGAPGRGGGPAGAGGEAAAAAARPGLGAGAAQRLGPPAAGQRSAAGGYAPGLAGGGIAGGLVRGRRGGLPRPVASAAGGGLRTNGLPNGSSGGGRTVRGVLLVAAAIPAVPARQSGLA